MSAAIDGDTSSITTSLRREVVDEVTRTPGLDPCRRGVRCRPPARRRSPANRPRATTHPLAWQATISISPTALVIGRSRREKACAATPAQSARACSVRHVRASAVAGSIAPAPKRASVSGWRGTRRTGCEASANKSSKCAASARTRAAIVRPSLPRPRRSARSTGTARRPNRRRADGRSRPSAAAR